LKEDRELADAIKRGDAETVAKIRERRKHYSNLLLLFALAFLTFGCSHKNIPLTSDNVPYQLPAGQYIDTKGIMHVEQSPRWSLSEADLYNNTRQIKEPNHFQKYWSLYTYLGIALLAILFFRKK